MNTKCKVLTEAGPRTLGRPVGVLPLGPRSDGRLGQRKLTRVEARGLKRTTSADSLKLRNIPSSRLDSRTLSNSGNAGITKLPRRRSHAGHEEQKLGLAQSKAIEQATDDVVDRSGTAASVTLSTASFARAASDGTISTADLRVGSSQRAKLVLTTSDILKLCLETDPEKVFEVDLHGKNLTATPNLNKFLKLRVLDLSGNYLHRISGLEFNQELRDLKLYDNSISVIEGLECLKDLHCLQLQHNKITAIGPGLNSLKKLQSLRLDNNQIGSIRIPELVSCINIVTLDLSHNKLESLAPLTYLPNLEELTAAGNRISQTGELSKCRKLQEVDLSMNYISDLSGLSNLPHLQILNVSHNQLRSLKSLGKLRSLEELDVSSNRLQELANVCLLFPNLQILFLSDNLITDWNQIFSLSSCQQLVELSVSNNPFTREDGQMPDYHQVIKESLPTLEVIDGVMLTQAATKPEGAPLMRPMSAGSIISLSQIDTKLKAASEEHSAMMKQISEQFDVLRSLMDTLPAQSPTPRLGSSCLSSLGSSRCSRRARLKEAQDFAAKSLVDGNSGDETF